jgi:hypothetical protein
MTNFATAEIKGILMAAAYQASATELANALPVGQDGKPLPVVADPAIYDPGLRAKNLAVYENAKVHYAALLNAFGDQTGIWPDPSVPSPAPSGAASAPVASRAPVPSPGHDLAATVAGVANALSPAVPQAGLVGQVAGAVSSALAGAGK